MKKDPVGRLDRAIQELAALVLERSALNTEINRILAAHIAIKQQKRGTLKRLIRGERNDRS